jgi:sugar phosphate isomerase/epimerase
VKLKYAFMSFSCPQLGLDELLATARRFGYDGIEPRAEAGHGHGVEANAPAPVRQMIREQTAQAAIPICCIATSCRYSVPETLAQQVDTTRRFIDLAGDLGVPALRVFGGQIPQGIAREAAIDRLAGALDQFAAQAADRHVMVCVETHDDWSNPAHMAEVMKRVGHPSIAVNWDIMHPVRQGGATMDEAFALLKPYVRHVHFHDGLTRQDQLVMTPIGQGEIDHRRAVQLLRDASYAGYLSGEWIDWEPYEQHLPRELAAMKAYEE